MFQAVLLNFLLMGQPAFPGLGSVSVITSSGEKIGVTMRTEDVGVVAGEKLYDYNTSGPMGVHVGKFEVTQDPVWNREIGVAGKIPNQSEADANFIKSALETVILRKFESGTAGGKFRFKGVIEGWNERNQSVSTRSLMYRALDVYGDYLRGGEKVSFKVGQMLVPTGSLSEATFQKSEVADPDAGSRDPGKFPPGLASITVTPWRPEFKDIKEIIRYYDLKFVSKSMQRFIVTGVNPDPEVAVITLQPGIMLAPGRASVQHVGLATELKMVLQPRSVFASLHGSAVQERSTAVGNSLCLEFHMEAPKDDPMTMVLPNNSKLVRLLEYVGTDSKIDRADQISVWILNDAVTLTQLQSTLKPSPNEAIYVKGLYEAGAIGKVDLRSAEYAPCLDPDHLIPAGDPVATKFVGVIIAEQKPAPLLKTLEREESSLRTLLVSGTSSERAHVQALIEAAGGSSTKALRTWAADFLLGSRKAITSPGTIQQIGNSGTLRSFQQALLVSEAPEAEKAIQVLGAYQQADSIPWLRSASDSLPEATRRKAIAVADEIGNSGTLR